LAHKFAFSANFVTKAGHAVTSIVYQIPRDLDDETTQDPEWGQT
jgi:hypothetical protein